MQSPFLDLHHESATSKVRDLTALVDALRSRTHTFVYTPCCDGGTIVGERYECSRCQWWNAAGGGFDVYGGRCKEDPVALAQAEADLTAAQAHLDHIVTLIRIVAEA